MNYTRNVLLSLAAVISFSPLAYSEEVSVCEDVTVRTEAYYYGQATCSVYIAGLGNVQVDGGYVSSHPSQYITLYAPWQPNQSCQAKLPYKGTRAIKERVCTTKDLVATADVYAGQMRVQDSSCRWDGWRSSYNVRLNRLYCGSEVAAVVSQIEGGGYQNGRCGVNPVAGYSASGTGQNWCDIKVYRD